MSKDQGSDDGRTIAATAGDADLLILKALALEPLHGWAVSERLQQISRDALRLGRESATESSRELVAVVGHVPGVA